MPRERRQMGWIALLRAGLLRSRWQTTAGLIAAMVAAGALAAALSLLLGMDRMLESGKERLGGDLVIALPGSREAVAEWMRTGSASQPVPAEIDVAAWRRKLKEARIIGLTTSQGIDLSSGGRGAPSYPKASILVLRLESWASPLMTALEVEAAIPEAEVIVGEQATRHVLTDLQPLVRHLTTAAGVALLAAVLINGLLASLRVGQRRAELGMLRAVGASRGFMIGVVLAESLVLALLGGALGVLLAAGGLWLLPGAGGLLGHLTPLELAGLGGVAIGATALAGVLAAIGPAIQTARLDPLDAVRRHR